MSFQFQYLIDEPLRELASQGKGIPRRTVVIVDGLDECEGPAAQAEIIRIIVKATSDGTLPLCWAFFSRGEPHIQATFSSPSVSPHCYKVVLPISRDADGEIEMYLKNGFENILERHNISVESQWPSVEDMVTLVNATDGSFIFAAMVLRFVDHLGLPGPQKRLRIIINTVLERPHAGTTADGLFSKLDIFYRLILQRIPTEIFPSVHLLLAVICRYGSLGVVSAANILGLSKEEFEIVCNHASAVVHLQDPGKDLEIDPTITTNCTYTQVNRDALHKLYRQVCLNLGGQVGFYHKSFGDFLLSPARSGPYCVKGSKSLAKHYLKIHLHYDQTYSWEGSELVLAPGVTDSGSSLSYPYTNELVNSLIKTRVYTEFGSEGTESFSAFGVFGALGGAGCDFRKRLHVASHLESGIRSLPLSTQMWGCEFQCKFYPGTVIGCAALARFDVNEFKSMVKQCKQAKIIQQCHPKWPSQFKSLFHHKSREHFESALYRVGQGDKSIFWYWEINHEFKHYRHFKTVVLVEGEKRLREEGFGAWPRWGYEWVSESVSGSDSDSDSDSGPDPKSESIPSEVQRDRGQ